MSRSNLIRMAVASAAAAVAEMAPEIHHGPGPGDWRIVGPGPKIMHRVPGKKGTRPREVQVKSHYATLIDRSRYPGHVLREIRSSTHNARGEMRR